MRIGGIHHVRRIIVDEVQPVLFVSIVHHRLRQIVAIDRIESAHVQELFIEQEHRLVRVRLERYKSGATDSVLVTELDDARVFKLFVWIL